jgi:hypothetical protein
MSSGIIVSKEMNLTEPTEVILEYQISENCFKITIPHIAANEFQIGTSNPRYSLNVFSFVGQMNHLLSITFKYLVQLLSYNCIELQINFIK